MTLCIAQTTISCIIPAVEYYFIFRFDNTNLGACVFIDVELHVHTSNLHLRLYTGPQAWALWAILVVSGLIGVLAHGTEVFSLTLLHLVTTTVFSAASAAYTTAWWFVLQLQCSVAQSSYSGCNPASCPCVTTNSCTGGDLATVGCKGCLAPRLDVCHPVAAHPYNQYLLAFTGLLILVAAIPVVITDVLVLRSIEARHTASKARVVAVRVGVEQQVRLISAGDKPTVTPGTLKNWVTELFMSKCSGQGDKIVAETCVVALQRRGYELPLPHGLAVLIAKNRNSIHKDYRDVRGRGEGGASALQAQQSGRQHRRRHQVTPSEDWEQPVQEDQSFASLV